MDLLFGTVESPVPWLQLWPCVERERERETERERERGRGERDGERETEREKERGRGERDAERERETERNILTDKQREGERTGAGALHWI